MYRFLTLLAVAMMASLSVSDAFAMGDMIVNAAGATPLALAGLGAAGLTLPRALLSGVAANTDPKVMLAALQSAIGDFKENHRQEMSGVQLSIDDMNAKIAHHLLHGDGGSGGTSPSQTRAAREAFGKFIQTGDEASIQAMRNLAPQAALSVGSNPDGGFLVPQELDRTIVELQRNASVMRRLAKTVQTNGSSFEIPVNLQGTGSGWVGETAARPQTTAPTFAKLVFPSGEIYAEPAVTQRLLDDAPQNISTWLEGEISQEFDKQEGSAFLTGDGVNKPKGILFASPVAERDATRPFGTYGYVASSAVADISTDSMIDLCYSLRAGYRTNGTWLMNSTTLARVRKFKDAGGQYLWQPSLELRAPGTLLGYPVEADEAMPDIAAGSFPIAFGDFNRGYLIADRLGIRILRDPYSAKPYVLFYATKRVGGGPLDTNAVRFMKVGNT